MSLGDLYAERNNYWQGAVPCLSRVPYFESLHVSVQKKILSSALATPGPIMKSAQIELQWRIEQRIRMHNPLPRG